MKGKFYGIGVGPGDPELLTLKAVRVLANIDVLAVPESKREAGSVAHDIARPYLKAGVEVLTLTFPMIRDAEAKTKIRRDNALRIIEKIDAGLNVAFLTLGDPMLYSTYIYLLDNMKDQGIDIVSIPGIYSFSAISNLLNEPLVKGDESMAVISEFNPEAWEKLQSVQTIVCMKVSAYGGQLFDALQRQSDRKMVMVTNAGKETQTVSYNQEDMKGDIPYFTTVIVSKTE